MKTATVEHSELFATEFEYNDVGHLRPGTKERLARLRKSGCEITITGPITETAHGRRALLSAMYDHGLEFDRIDHA